MTAEIIAWLEGPEGEAWSRGRGSSSSSSPLAMFRYGLGDPGEDPCGRPPLTPENGEGDAG